MAAPAPASTAPLAVCQLCGSEKREDIEEILNVLEVDFEEKHISPIRRNEVLEKLRVHTTSLNDLDPLLTKRGVSLLCRYGFDVTSPTTGRVALRCLCNILLLAEPTRQLFVDENCLKEATELMKNAHPEDELLSARLLLLCTYGTNLNFDPFFGRYSIAEIINTFYLDTNSNIGFLEYISPCEALYEPRWFSATSHRIAACNETLKLLYNLTTHYRHQAPLFSESLHPILQMLNSFPIPSPPLQPPVSSLINSLVHLDLEGKKPQDSTPNPLFPQFDSKINVDRFASILDLAIRTYNDEDMDTYCSPLVQVLLRIAECAPLGPKARLRALLLPSNKDRERVLGSGDSLPARLLRLSTAITAFHLRELVQALLFELSDKNVKRFVRNVGYGFAADFLLSKGVQLPSSALRVWGTGDVDGDNTDRSKDGSKIEEADGGNSGDSTEAGTESSEVNPITGQRRDMESEPSIREITDEEREREAERLFVLFERLQATGVIDVENPVAQAVREGWLEGVD